MNRINKMNIENYICYSCDKEIENLFAYNQEGNLYFCSENCYCDGIDVEAQHGRKAMSKGEDYIKFI